MQNEILLSLVVPTYNEEQRIEHSLQEISDFLEKQPYRSEIIVVDDGSSDRTVDLVQAYMAHRAARTEIRILRNQRNMGKGYAVKNGVLHARGDVVLFTDADLSAPIDQAPKLLDPIFANECDIAFGSRALKGSVIAIHQPRWRETAGRIFNIFVRVISRLNFRDTQCGFKAFRREPALEIFKLQTINGFGFDAEVLYIAQKHGLRLREIPIVWSDSAGTKVRFYADAPKMFFDLLKIRLNDLLGRYEQTSNAA